MMTYCDNCKQFKPCEIEFDCFSATVHLCKECDSKFEIKAEKDNLNLLTDEDELARTHD